jgi:hypothetical protein
VLGDLRNAYTILVGKSEEKRPFARLRSRCEDNIKIYLEEIGNLVSSRLIWVRTGTNFGLLSTR